MAQSLFYLLDRTTVVSGKYDTTMEERVSLFQMTNGLEVNACMDDVTWSKLFARVGKEIAKIDNMLLKDDFITQKALENDLSPAAVKAVIKVESRGRGFNRDEKEIILFEGHIFWKELNNIGIDPYSILRGNEDILYKKPNYKYYNRPQYPRLEKAKDIDEVVALKSASYGMFQVMGFNYKLAGFTDVENMVNTLSKNEKNQYDIKLEKAYNNSKLTKGIGTSMNEETYTSMYALELDNEK